MRKSIFFYIFLVGLFILPNVSAELADGDITIVGLELEKLLSLINGVLGTVLFIFAYLAYKRDGRQRLLFVSLAFLLFAIRGFLIGSELFIPEIAYIDPIAGVLEFAIILSFFFGIIKK